jgi:DNA-directed RNA polymerase specialized sigma24 family protein
MTTSPQFESPQDNLTEAQIDLAGRILGSVLERYFDWAPSQINAHYRQTLFPELKQQLPTRISNYKLDVNRWLFEVERFTTKFVEEKFSNLIHDGDFVDDELVRLANGGIGWALDHLMERYSMLVRKIVSGIVFARSKCPPSQDRGEFVNDVISRVNLRIIEKLHTYRFEAPFQAWVGVIAAHEAENERIETDGEAQAGPRRYISWEDYERHAPVIGNEEHVDILNRIIAIYRNKDERSADCVAALYLKHYQGYKTKDVAVRIGLTVDSLFQLYSHDYRELRKLCLDKFGFSGTDL